MGRQTQTIQATGKLWKLLQLVGGILMVGSVAVGCTGFFGLAGDANPEAGAAGGAIVGLSVLGLAAGLIVYLIGRLGAWWFHG